ncbi:PREDICTED: solute carrier family 22 member 16-like, partial [Ceratosolen solmsi marchali]|uniref:Solute carrier family 22 member 16-like n=1 Tax=Ceratosolen solmsi marchali TaxID=326594 RepID=A0AAJ6YTK3_9HYME
LNVDAVSVNYYLYALLLGVTEIPAYLLPTPVLMVMGRRQASSILFGTSGLLLIVILALPRSQTVAIVSVNLISRFSLSAAYGIMILYASELFPTIARSSALGTSAAMAHVGSIVAPFSVDNLVTLAWWGPSTLCGVLVLGAALACLVLPETRDRPLADSVEEEPASTDTERDSLQRRLNEKRPEDDYERSSDQRISIDDPKPADDSLAD